MLGLATEAQLLQLLDLIDSQDNRIKGLIATGNKIADVLEKQGRINDALTNRLIALEKKVNEAK